ncbi:GNAT family N-acetyltransferase [Streptomyces sp. NBC_00932]|uniref:GNAT family N-acetyltransferase n=1 Tax=Streptomyces sp. NBC_00932 TaxID=2903690 RepID=UPI0038699773
MLDRGHQLGRRRRIPLPTRPRQRCRIGRGQAPRPSPPQHSRLITARFDDVLAGWVVLNHDPYRLVGHWGTVNHLQAHPEFRGRGVGSALMRELRKIARNDVGLEQLNLAARGEEGLEDFYSRLGRREVGRWPGALRLAPDDTLDEVLMLLDPL